jgi:hypothetical protein
MSSSFAKVATAEIGAAIIETAALSHKNGLFNL